MCFTPDIFNIERSSTVFYRISGGTVDTVQSAAICECDTAVRESVCNRKSESLVRTGIAVLTYYSGIITGKVIFCTENDRVCESLLCFIEADAQLCENSSRKSAR